MRLSPSRWALTLATLAATPIAAERVISSNSLTACMQHSGLTAELLYVAFTPNNNTLFVHIQGVSTVSDHVTAEIQVAAYGYPIFSEDNLDPCDTSSDGISLQGLCPMEPGPLETRSNFQISSDAVSQIPGVAYSVPDLDGVVQIRLYHRDQDTGARGQLLACVQADLTNGKTVYQKGVGWATAVIAGLALLTSAIVAGLGHSNTATHVAANTMSLFGFFQSQAVFGLAAVPLPPIVQSWTQNFQWSMGIIRVGFIQDIAFWYQQSTGGLPTTYLSNLGRISVDVQKRAIGTWSRAIEQGFYEYAPAVAAILKRQITTGDTSGEPITVRGIERVGFRAGIEPSNVFLTGYIFFIVFVHLISLVVIIARFVLEALAKSGKIKGDKFLDFRNGWTTVLRGILYRVILIGLPQMTILCLWELVHQDSPGEIALAVVTVLTIIFMLGWACAKVWLLARRSISMHKNPAYILYSDPVCLHKWGFLYVQYKARTYWFIIPTLGFVFAIGAFIAFAQGSGVAQAVALLVLNAGYLVTCSIMRPWMDKKTNAFNTSIAAINFVSSIFMLFFTKIFGLPGLVVGIMGVIFFIMNAVFALVLLILVLIATFYAIFSKNPDVRYQPMRDDRGSFIKSQPNVATTTELDALGATARGESKHPFKRDFDSDSYDNVSMEERQMNGGYGPLPTSYANPHSARAGSQRSGMTGTAYEGSTLIPGGPGSGPPSMTGAGTGLPARTASPWQRGAGYDH